MQQQTTVSLMTVFSEVLADLAFMFTDEEVDGASASGSWLETVITYRGPKSGTLKLRCPKRFAALLASNLLGTDASSSKAENEGEDAVKEFMNIVCGQLVTSLYGTEHVFNLSIPAVVELPDAPDLTPLSTDECATLSVDGHTVQLSHLGVAET